MIEKIEVNQILTGKGAYNSSPLSVSREGMILSYPAEDFPDVKFVWLDLTIKSEERKIRALGEITGISGTNGSRTMSVKFKHIFPKDKILFEKSLH